MAYGEAEVSAEKFAAGFIDIDPIDQPGTLPLYPHVDGAVIDGPQEAWARLPSDEIWVRNVTKPTLTPFLPTKGKGNGLTVLIVPGGGFKFVSVSNEGWPIAKWLADCGIAAFVLKYRTDEVPSDVAFFARQMIDLLAPKPSTEEPMFILQETIARAREDAQEALRIIRENAAFWGVDPSRVGMLGFSAGAMTTLATVLADESDARPDFIGLIYGAMVPVNPPPKPPPLFAAIAVDDQLLGQQGFGLVDSWSQAGGLAEFHLYSGGGHGFGSHKKGTTSDLWFDQFVAWLMANCLMEQVSR